MTTTQITLQNVVDLANVDDALADFYATSIASAATAAGVGQREIRQWIEDDLISPDGFRTQSHTGPGERGTEVLRMLEDSHLIRAESRRGAQWYELSHDRLVKPVLAANEAWRAGNLSMLQLRAREWDRARKPDGLLVGGDVLAEAQQWATDHPDALSPVDDEYLEKCRKVQLAASRIRLLAAVASAMLLLAILGLVLALVLKSRADAARADAEDQTTIAVAALKTADQQTAIAEGALDDADEQRREAEAQRSEAEAQAAAALSAEDEAQRQAEIAAAAAANAKKQEQIARDALDDAVAAREAADAQKVIADQKALDASEAEARALELQQQEEDQRKLAEQAAQDLTKANADLAAAVETAKRQTAAAIAAQGAAEAAKSQALVAESQAVAARSDALDVLKSVVQKLSEDRDFPIYGSSFSTIGGCATLQQSNLKSILGQENVTADYTGNNTLDGPVEVVWISPNGNRVPWATVPPGGFLQMFMVTGWVWEFTDSSGTCIGAFGDRLP